MSENETVLVVGATGRQGHAVARRLLSAGHQVLAGSRDPSSPRLAPLVAAGAEPVAVDLAEPGSLRAAARWADSVFLITVPGQEADERETGERAVRDLAAVDVRHVVYSSVAGADRDTGIPHFTAKFHVEQALADTGVPHTVVAPVFFMENPRPSMAASGGRVLAAPIAAETVLHQVSVADIASFVAHVLAEPWTHLSGRVELAGDALTGPEQAKLLGDVLGWPVRYRTLPADPARFGPDLAAMFRWFDEVGYGVDVDALHRAYPEVPWTSFAEWAERNARWLTTTKEMAS